MSCQHSHPRPRPPRLPAEQTGEGVFVCPVLGFVIKQAWESESSRQRPRPYLAQAGKLFVTSSDNAWLLHGGESSLTASSFAGPEFPSPGLQFSLHSWPHSLSGPREQQVPSIRIQDTSQLWRLPLYLMAQAASSDPDVTCHLLRHTDPT